MDYEEELWLDRPEDNLADRSLSSQATASLDSSSMGWASELNVLNKSSNGATSSSLDVPIEVVSDDVIDQLLYAFRDVPTAKPSPSDQLEWDDAKHHQAASESALEILDQISIANLEAMTMAHGDSYALAEKLSMKQETAHEVVVDNRVVRGPKPGYASSKSPHANLSRPNRPSILSFAEIQDSSNEAIRDDRDLLIIEEDVLQITSGIPTGAYHESVSQASVHPYKQLFSKLRG
jgi:hypothetical protein